MLERCQTSAEAESSQINSNSWSRQKDEILKTIFKTKHSMEINFSKGTFNTNITNKSKNSIMMNNNTKNNKIRDLSNQQQNDNSLIPLKTPNKETLFQPFIKTPSTGQAQVAANQQSTTSMNVNVKDKDAINNKKKKVVFTTPFTDIVNVESWKEFNLQMTYSKYEQVPEINQGSYSRECPCKINCLIF